MGAKTPLQTKAAVGRRLLLAGLPYGSSKKERAAACGLPATSLGDYERGSRAIGSQALIKVCVAFRVSPNKLLGWRQPERGV
jgi:transcriptional regulator with XRE-family HTH domain